MTENVSAAVLNLVLGRMLQANDTLLESSRYSGSPLIDAPTSWQYLLWKYEYDAQQAKGTTCDDMQEVILSNAIQVEGNQALGLISGVPPESLIELRRNGAMSELREIIGKGIKGHTQS